LVTSLSLAFMPTVTLKSLVEEAILEER